MAFACGAWDQDASSHPALGAGPTVSPFLSLLLSISAGLSEAELDSMKFLCRDKITKRRRESVRSGRELFEILMEQQHIGSDNLHFLRKLLERIRRGDLLSQLEQFEEEGGLGTPDDQPDEQEKRLLKLANDVICENIGRDWKKLLRQLGMPEVKLDRIEADYQFKSYEQLVQGLREWQRWKGKDANVADLIKALRGCHLNLVADLVEEKISQLNLEPDEINIKTLPCPSDMDEKSKSAAFSSGPKYLSLVAYCAISLGALVN
ncbi:LOW QUALITY PROTEIN: FAS-associated death domain protein [Pseudopipra pipra]|uniref:LOW QUALITY PROTEIN: FAS-associated death domain protein n=1 Tax=Pseudopipra pipra TaxID=415032 RepID=UPI0031394AA8